MESKVLAGCEGGCGADREVGCGVGGGVGGELAAAGSGREQGLGAGAGLSEHRKLESWEMGRISAEEYRQRPASGVVVVLDNIRSSHNIGSAFRSSDAFAVDRVVLCGICDTPPSAAIHKSALGAEFSVPWCHYDSTLDAVAALRAEGYKIFSVEQTVGSISLGDFRREPGCKYALVLGNEVDGVQQAVVDVSDGALEIPQYGTKHSLNVSVTVGVVLWEVTRR